VVEARENEQPEFTRCTIGCFIFMERTTAIKRRFLEVTLMQYLPGIAYEALFFMHIIHLTAVCHA
jgi:hypothetical protein